MTNGKRLVRCSLQGPETPIGNLSKSERDAAIPRDSVESFSWMTLPKIRFVAMDEHLYDLLSVVYRCVDA